MHARGYEESAKDEENRRKQDGKKKHGTGGCSVARGEKKAKQDAKDREVRR